MINPCQDCTESGQAYRCPTCEVVKRLVANVAQVRAGGTMTEEDAQQWRCYTALLKWSVGDKCGQYVFNGPTLKALYVLLGIEDVRS